VIVTTLEEVPGEATHWSTRFMARATGRSPSAISRIWRAFGLPPHPVETFRLANDPLFIEKRRDVVGLYLDLPDVASGKVIGQLHDRHRAVGFRRFLQRIDQEVAADLEVHLILDNSSVHKAPIVHRWLVGYPRFHLHFTPTYASWLNLVERWFAELNKRWIRRGSHRSTVALEAAIRDRQETWNANPRPLVWVKTAEQILESIALFCHRILDSGH